LLRVIVFTEIFFGIGFRLPCGPDEKGNIVCMVIGGIVLSKTTAHGETVMREQLSA
jgi:hypothetical protein